MTAGDSGSRRSQKRRSRNQDLAAVLAERHPSRFDTFVILEPELRFGYEQKLVDPKVGLALYGPHDLTDRGRRSAIRLGLIGTGPLVDLTRQWLARCQSEVRPVRRVRKAGAIVDRIMDPRAFPPFPGTEIFSADFVIGEGLVEVFTPSEIEAIERIELFEPRVTHVVELIVNRLRVLADKPIRPDVVVIALPTSLRRLCTVPSRHKRRKQVWTVARALKADLAADEEVGQNNLFNIADALGVDLGEDEEEHLVFHSALKARAMMTDLPTQLVWESTLVGGTTVEDDATRAWNLWTGIYYKGGGIPWRVAGLDGGSCFVGLAFYRDRREEGLRTCMAQVFSDHGEGFVLRGEPFKWEGSKSPHLAEKLARDLMIRVLGEYESHLKQKPKRVVVHKWQRYWEEERRGLEDVLKNSVHAFDLVAFGSRGIRFYRTGMQPPLRGTMIRLGRHSTLLFTRGYVPFIQRYQGMRVPRPLEIVEHFGAAPMTQICHEILALTKLDWNSTAFSGKQPITTAFSQDVGHILAELPRDASQPKTQYRFYM